MGDKGEGGVKNLKNWAISFMDGPYAILNLLPTIFIKVSSCLVVIFYQYKLTFVA